MYSSRVVTNNNFHILFLGPVKHIIDQSYEEKSVAKKKTTIIPSLAKKGCVDSNLSLIILIPFLLW